ncbi:inorganic pyrophosphatase [Planoprotostelium fungivorum]|uniref:inorganic diphosphatase n=1 Tax=Planoprotostelium fungivorum TaxID=1890364 RepID=A0A2P6N1A0_9EUKA|nr:inorganic pyrophosphatase [Planoprotostelium fungivorum]
MCVHLRRVNTGAQGPESAATDASIHFDLGAHQNSPHRHSIMSYSYKQVGQPETLEYRVFLHKDGVPVSPFHDVPLHAGQGVFNMLVEIPRGTQPKLEISKEEYLNPIKQDVKNGKLRNVAYKYPFNYGAFPQTWENPSFVHPDTQAKGDNDPVDVVDISESLGKTGEIRQVKVLGTYAMIDEGETDWKIVVIEVNDPNASKINEHSDIEKVLPGKLKEVFEFLRDYKVPDGKPQNTFAFNNELKDKAFALQVVEETYHEWKDLISGKITGKISLQNTQVTDSPFKRVIVTLNVCSTYLDPLRSSSVVREKKQEQGGCWAFRACGPVCFSDGEGHACGCVSYHKPREVYLWPCPHHYVSYSTGPVAAVNICEVANNRQDDMHHEQKMEEFLGWDVVRHIFSILFRDLYNSDSADNQQALQAFGVCQQVSRRWREECQPWFDPIRLEYRPFWNTYNRCNHPVHRKFLQRLSAYRPPFDNGFLGLLRANATGEIEQDKFVLELLENILDTSPDLLGSRSDERDRRFFANIIIHRGNIQDVRQFMSSTSPLPLAVWFQLTVSADSQEVLAHLLEENDRKLLHWHISDELRRMILHSKCSIHPSWLIAAIDERDIEMIRTIVPRTKLIGHIFQQFLAFSHHNEFIIRLPGLCERKCRGNSIEWKDLMQWECVEPLIREGYTGPCHEKFLLEAVKMNRADLVDIVLRQKHFYSRGETTETVLTAIRSASADIIDTICRSVQIDLSFDREQLQEAMRQCHPELLELVDVGVHIHWPEDAPQMDELIGRKAMMEITLATIRGVRSAVTDPYRSESHKRVLRDYATFRLVCRRWARELEIQLGLSYLTTEPFYITYQNCDHPGHRNFLLRILRQPNVTFERDVYEHMRWTKPSRERDLFNAEWMWDIIRGHLTTSTIPSHLCLSFAQSIIHIEELQLLREILAAKFDFLSERKWMKLALVSVKMITYLAERYSEHLEEVFHVGGQDEAYLDSVLVLARRYPALRRRPVCFEFVNCKDERWMKDIITPVIQQNVRGMNSDMREKVLSPEVLSLCHSFYYFFTAIEADFHDLAVQIAPHLQLSVELLVSLLTPPRRIRSASSDVIVLTKNFSLLDIADWGCIDLLGSIIKEGAKTEFNNSILHAVVRSGRIDLLRLMERKMWFSSGEKNEALLEAIRGRKEEVVEILCRSKKINLSVNREELVQAALSQEKERIIESRKTMNNIATHTT